MSERRGPLSRARALFAEGKWRECVSECEHAIERIDSSDRDDWIAVRMLHAAAVLETPVDLRVVAAERSSRQIRDIIGSDWLALGDPRRGHAYVALASLAMLARGGGGAVLGDPRAVSDALRKAGGYFERIREEAPRALVAMARAVVLVQAGDDLRKDLPEAERLLGIAMEVYQSPEFDEERAECSDLLEWCRASRARLGC